MQAQFDPTRSDAIEFTVRNEPWVKYELEDGSLLFTRLVVTKIYKTNQYDAAGQPVYGWSTQSLFSTVCKKEIKGTPSSVPITTIDSREYDATPVDFQKVGDEEWNVYQVADGTVISLKIEVSSVMKTEKFLPDGDPFYIVNSGVLPKVKVPPILLKRQRPVQQVSFDKRALYN